MEMARSYLVFSLERRQAGVGGFPWGSMELAVVIIALIVAGALIPDHSKIVFYR